VTSTAREIKKGKKSLIGKDNLYQLQALKSVRMTALYNEPLSGENNSK
jgi:hypothetical protein